MRAWIVGAVGFLAGALIGVLAVGGIFAASAYVAANRPEPRPVVDDVPLPLDAPTAPVETMDSTEAIADGLPALRRRVLWQEVLEPKASQSILRSTIDASRRKWYDSARDAERSLRDSGGSSSSSSGGMTVLDGKWLDFSREDKISAFRSTDHGVSMMTTILSFDDRIIVYTTVVEGGLPERR